MQKTTLFLSGLLLCACTTQPHVDETITIDMTQRGADIRESMYGIFIEDINRCVDGGLLAELVLNRSFDELQGWSLHATDSTLVSMSVSKDHPFFSSAPNHLSLTVSEGAGSVSLCNTGYSGCNVIGGMDYTLRVIAKPEAPSMRNLKVALVSADGSVLAATQVTLNDLNRWNEVSLQFTAVGTDPQAHIEVSLSDNSTGAIRIDYISIVPHDTYKGHGMRRDIAEAIAALRPAFVRWPGGCVVEGITLDNRFRWKQTLGDPASRPGIYNLWGYHTSCGIGWHEMLQFCEDIDAAVMYVCNVGMACQGKSREVLPMHLIEPYLQECLDAIEYAIGDTTTVWGRERARNGHPAPFNLQYVELGNENSGPAYHERYNYFYENVKARYPQLTLLSNYGIDGTYDAQTVEMIDPHWYVAPRFFYNNTSLFDSIPRGQWGIYVGEYACNRSVGTGNMDAALSEAAFLTGCERNSDLVWMTSYAPLLESNWHRSWPTNLIWFSPSQVMGRSSYYVQQMMACNRPAYNLPLSITASDPEPVQYPRGQIGFGTWMSRIDIQDLRLTAPDGTVTTPSLSQGKSYQGSWQTSEDGQLLQLTDLKPRCKYLLDVDPGDTYTASFRARLNEGKDAFIFWFGMTRDGSDGYYWSIGGQNNSKLCVETILSGDNCGQDGDICPFHAEAGQWYDIRVEVTPDSSLLYVDDQLLLTHRPMSNSKHAYACGYDPQGNEVVIKAVNASGTPYTVQYNLNGAKAGTTATSITLSAESLDAENTFDAPDRISPVTSTFTPQLTGSESGLIYQFEPYSFTILRIPIR